MIKYPRIYWETINAPDWKTQLLLDRCVDNGVIPFTAFKQKIAKHPYVAMTSFKWKYWGVNARGRTEWYSDPTGFGEGAIEFHPEMFCDDSPLWKDENPTEEELLVYASLYGEFPEILRKQL